MRCMACAEKTRVVRTVKEEPVRTVRVRVCSKCGTVFLTDEMPREKAQGGGNG